MSRLPRTLGLMRHVQDEGYLLKLRGLGRFLERRLDGLGDVLEGRVRLPSPYFDTGTGQYLVGLEGGTTRRVCIDAVDYPDLSSPELVGWSDVYFKTNWWPSVDYPQNVRPLVNGDPMVLDRIASLRAARSTPKKYDLCCIVRVWGGRDTVEGIEHNLRLLEAVKRGRGAASCSRCLWSGIGRSTRGDSNRQVFRRRRDRFLPPDLATHRSVEAEHHPSGVHDCVPWRMTGSLALGLCVVLDQSPGAGGRNRYSRTKLLSLGLDTKAIGPSRPTKHTTTCRSYSKTG